MKRLTIFCLSISILLAACGTSPASVPTLTLQAAKTATETEAATVTPTTAPVQTSTPIPATPTVALAQLPTYTPSAPETCPQVDAKLRAQFGPVFKNKKLAYHDARQAMLDFLNEGGDPKTAVAKLAENDIIATQMDLTNDGVPEFLLPSGYYTIFGCKGGKYQTLLEIAPYGSKGYEAVPLVIQDLNQDGIPEIFIAQVTGFNQAKYSLLEWDGKNLLPITPKSYGDKDKYVYIENYDIYTIGKSNAEQGVITGNWEIIDTDNDGLKEIAIKAGVDATFFYSSDLEEQIILKSTGAAYKVVSHILESTPTNTPTPTALPFSATCDYKAPSVQYVQNDQGIETAIKNFLNAGGDAKKLQSSFDTVIVKDLTNDGLLDVLIGSIHSVYVFTCIDGKYQQQLHFPLELRGETIGFMTVQDINKDGLPEIVMKAPHCFCGVLYIAAWNGKEFIGLIKGSYNGKEINYAILSDGQDVYLKDLDGDDVLELIWIGGIPGPYEDQSGLPWRRETHTYKWEGKYYTPQPVEYSTPVYRFQAVQDGDRFALNGQFEKALRSYRLATQNNSLSWWTEAREEYLLGAYGIGPCAVNSIPCSPPTPDPDEQPILKAYSSYRTMLTQIMMSKPDEAKTTYESLLSFYPSGNPGYPIVEMATAFWNEYQSSQNVADACSESIAYAENHVSVLAYIGISYHGWQSQTYKPVDICPFK